MDSKLGFTVEPTCENCERLLDIQDVSTEAILNPDADQKMAILNILEYIIKEIYDIKLQLIKNGTLPPPGIIQKGRKFIW